MTTSGLIGTVFKSTSQYSIPSNLDAAFFEYSTKLIFFFKGTMVRKNLLSFYKFYFATYLNINSNYNINLMLVTLFQIVAIVQVKYLHLTYYRCINMTTNWLALISAVLKHHELSQTSSSPEHELIFLYLVIVLLHMLVTLILSTTRTQPEHCT